MRKSIEEPRFFISVPVCEPDVRAVARPGCAQPLRVLRRGRQAGAALLQEPGVGVNLYHLTLYTLTYLLLKIIHAS